MQREPAPELLQFMAPYPSHVLELILAARELLYENCSDATEIIWDAISACVTGLSYTHTHAKGFVHVPAYSNHINIGFDRGVDLTDPEGRLLGVGNRIRHIKIFRLDDLKDPYLLRLIQEAEQKAFRPNPPLEPMTIVKVMNGTKRRPTPTSG